MFDFVHENKRVVQIVLLLIILPFAFWGVSSYRQSGADALATVEGESVSQQDFDNAVHQQQERMQQLTHGSFDVAMFDSPEVKKSILDSLINQKLLAVRARAVGFTLSDEQLAQIIAGEQAFQQDGKFDRQQYEAVLRKQNMSPPMFESRVKEQLALRQLAELYSQNGYASDSAADRLIRINEEQRVVSVAQIALEPFLKQVKIEDAAIKSYYDGNQPEFKTPERARVEYVVFSADALMSQMTADANEIKEYYDKHQAEFGTPEQRHAAHILIAVSAQASDADKKAAKAKADSILQQVKQTPAKFAELAKQFSADPGSAANGGDLGFFGRGMMVKSFDDAAFSLKPGEISSVVQTQYGFHIIKLLEVKAANIPPLAEMKTAITQKIKLLKAGDKFAELADKFSNTAYEQSDSLKPAAALAKMPVQQSGWLEKGQPGAAPWTDRALQAVFSDDVVKHKRNSSAVEIAPDTLLAVRLLEYKKADTRPLAEVSGTIRQKLLRQQAGELASKHGQAALAMLQRGEKPALKWAAAKTISRAQHGDMDAELARLAILADVGKLPVFVGTETAQGYMLARIDTVKEFGPIDEAKRARYLQQLRQLSGEELLQAYIADARKHASVSVKPFVVDKKG